MTQKKLKVPLDRKLHGVVDPLCGTSWEKWNWYKLHRGYRACPGTRKGLQRGYMTCPMGQGEMSWDLSQSQLGQTVLVPMGQAQFVPICVSNWDRLCLSQWLVPLGQARYRHHPSKVSPWPSLGSFLIKNQSSPNWILEIPYQKSVWNWSKTLTKNRFFLLSWPTREGEQANKGRRSTLRRAAAHLITRIMMPARGASRRTMRKSLHHLHLEIMCRCFRI